MSKILFTSLMIAISSILFSQPEALFGIYITQDSKLGFTQLNWEEPLVQPHIIKRKNIIDTEWTILDSLFTGDRFIDSSSITGHAYEYKISYFDKENLWQDNTLSFTFAYAGFEIPRVENRGRIMILVDSIHQVNLQSKIDRWILDVEGDGWEVIQQNVSQSTPPQTIKALIKEEYENVNGLEALFLLGHIPVPYSGNIWPDGHLDHKGAWPADVYYVEMNENWGDALPLTEFGKSNILDAEIQVGRVDFHDMPAFSESELELLKKYLDKNHAFRQKHFTPKMQATHIDNFNRGYDIAARNQFSVLVGSENTFKGNYRNNLLADSYIWSFGAGSGTYTSAGGISNTATMANDSLQGIFTMLFGSYFGDWDNTNNYLRSVLGSGTVLTASWGTRPTWLHFHMGLGMNIGFQAKLTQSDGIYSSGYKVQGATGMMDTFEFTSPLTEIHTSLLGDPSLRMHIMQPVSTFFAEETSIGVHLNWTFEGDVNLLEGFNIYKRSVDSTQFQWIQKIAANELSYIDTSFNPLGSIDYMVRPEKLEVTPSGSFYNQASGLQTVIEITIADLDNDGFTNLDDCDDSNPDINPDAEEIAYNGLDDDCDPATLDDDLDQDGFILADDCDDTNADINPDAEEIAYNGFDEDCNPMTLDDDLDQDGFLLTNDCDDANADINPDAEEICNDIDDNCNGLIDEELEIVIYYADNDEDGFGDSDVFLEDCIQPDGTVTNDGDCDDFNAEINPDAEEIANNGIDEDCDGSDLVTTTQKLNTLQIRISPNPTSDFITITGFENDAFRIEFYTITGQLVLSKMKSSTFSVAHLENGTYLLRLIDLHSNEFVYKRIFITK